MYLQYPGVAAMLTGTLCMHHGNQRVPPPKVPPKQWRVYPLVEMMVKWEWVNTYR